MSVVSVSYDGTAAVCRINPESESITHIATLLTERDPPCRLYSVTAELRGTSTLAVYGIGEMGRVVEWRVPLPQTDNGVSVIPPVSVDDCTGSQPDIQPVQVTEGSLLEEGEREVDGGKSQYVCDSQPPVVVPSVPSIAGSEWGNTGTGFSAARVVAIAKDSLPISSIDPSCPPLPTSLLFLGGFGSISCLPVHVKGAEGHGRTLFSLTHSSSRFVPMSACVGVIPLELLYEAQNTKRLTEAETEAEAERGESEDNTDSLSPPAPEVCFGALHIFANGVMLEVCVIAVPPAEGTRRLRVRHMTLSPTQVPGSEACAYNPNHFVTCAVLSESGREVMLGLAFTPKEGEERESHSECPRVVSLPYRMVDVSSAPRCNHRNCLPHVSAPVTNREAPICMAPLPPSFVVGKGGKQSVLVGGVHGLEVQRVVAVSGD
ncbi:hypothetical protein KIPB_011937 [Kipferlia bialata]|uniref:Uncharacterized protein n=1 Tax=Kipferlia bialata TaxID=797122 RepID=A0A391NQY6_9EUKA|nr:hypothetical protein KIPB_011937 [Kipferlia bialata]|eukprot:g11937.t1